MVERDKGMWLAQASGVHKDGDGFDLYVIIEADNRQDAEDKFKGGLYGHLLDDVRWTPPMVDVHSIAIDVPTLPS